MGACRASDAARREGLANGQKPYAIILSCSDSRVQPEIIFDKSLGELFVIWVAGNDPTLLSLEASSTLLSISAHRSSWSLAMSGAVLLPQPLTAKGRLRGILVPS